MAYSPQTWTNGVSKLNATRMTVIEAGIQAAALVADGAIPAAGGTSNDVPVGNGTGVTWQKIGNAQVAAAAAIAYSKLNLASSIVNGDVATSAAIAYSKLTLTGSIVNADVSGSAAIALSKLASQPGYAYARATADVDVANTTTETSLFSRSVTGGDMGTNKQLRLILDGDYLHNNAGGDTVRLRVKWGGTTIYDSGAVHSFGGVVGAARHPWRIHVNVSNKGAANSQNMTGMFTAEFADTAAPTTGIGGAASGAGAVFGWFGSASDPAKDTASAQTLDVTAQWSAASANNSFRMHYGLLELI